LTTENFWVERVRYQDISLFTGYHWNGKEKYDGYTWLFDTGVGGLRIGKGDAFGITPTEKIEKLRSFLSEEKPFDSASMLLLYSKKACLEENHRLAIIEAVAGLEVALYEFIYFKAKKSNLEKKEVNGFIRDIGLYGNITVVLKLLTVGLEQVDDALIEDCTKAIEVRNAIMHKGMLEVDATNTESRLLAIEKMIAYLKRVTNSLNV
jgi:hypothetical protein